MSGERRTAGAGRGGRGGARQVRLPGGRKRQTLVKMSDEEYLIISARARVAGVTVPRLLVESALAGDAATASELRALDAEFLGALRLLAAISRNINQLAIVANATGEVPQEIIATLHAAGRATNRLGDAALSLLPANARSAQRALARLLERQGAKAARVEGAPPVGGADEDER